MIEKTDKGWFQVVPVDEGSEEFDREFWASRSPEERIAAVWAMTVVARKPKGWTENELRLDRTHFSFQPAGD